jgi:hypothetical protein
MTRDFLLATITALGLTACSPDLSTETETSAAANDPALARAAKPEPGPSATEEPKEDEKKEDGEKTPR